MQGKYFLVSGTPRFYCLYFVSDGKKELFELPEMMNFAKEPTSLTSGRMLSFRCRD